MTPIEAAALLTVAAAFDNRKPNEDAATIWAVALDGLRPIDCKDAIVEYYKHRREWIMPSDIRDGVTQLRRDRIREMAHIQPPDGLEPPEYIAWMRDLQQRAGDGEVIEAPPHEVAAIVPGEHAAYLEGLNKKIDADKTRGMGAPDPVAALEPTTTPPKEEPA